MSNCDTSNLTQVNYRQNTPIDLKYKQQSQLPLMMVSDLYIAIKEDPKK